MQPQIVSLADIYKRSNEPKTKQDLEANYRRGYTDGYLAAINDLEGCWFLKKRERIISALWDHAMRALVDWQMAGGGFILPPEVPRKSRCVYCGEPGLEMDHVIPRSRGGSNADENLVPACYRCNREKRDMTPEEWRGG